MLKEQILKRNTCFKTGTIVRRMENKALDSNTSLNLLGITNIMCGISVGNETTLSSSSIFESSQQ